MMQNSTKLLDEIARYWEQVKNNKSLCAVYGCQGKRSARLMCPKHYQRFMSDTKYNPLLKDDVIKFIEDQSWKKVNKFYELHR